jgi:hypothetical protein
MGKQGTASLLLVLNALFSEVDSPAWMGVEGVGGSVDIVGAQCGRANSKWCLGNSLALLSTCAVRLAGILSCTFTTRTCLSWLRALQIVALLYARFANRLQPPVWLLECPVRCCLLCPVSCRLCA